MVEDTRSSLVNGVMVLSYRYLVGNEEISKELVPILETSCFSHDLSQILSQIKILSLSFLESQHLFIINS